MHPRNLHKTELRNALVAFLTLFCSMRSIGLIDLWGKRSSLLKWIYPHPTGQIFDRGPDCQIVEIFSEVQCSLSETKLQIFSPICAEECTSSAAQTSELGPKRLRNLATREQIASEIFFLLGTQMHQIFDTTSRCTLVNRLKILRIITTLLGPAFIDY